MKQNRDTTAQTIYVGNTWDMPDSGPRYQVLCFLYILTTQFTIGVLPHKATPQFNLQYSISLHLLLFFSTAGNDN